MNASTAIDTAAIRAALPSLSRRVHDDKSMIYLDAAASMPRPASVIDAVRAFDEQFPANVHRATHQLASEATQAFESARGDVARFINAASPEEIIFTRGTTEAINLFANSWGAINLSDGDEVLITAIEHHANIVPWQLLSQRTGCVLRVIDCRDDGSVDAKEAEAAITDRTRLVSITWISNALGTVVDVKAIVAAAKSRGITTHLDAAQAVPHRRVDALAIGADAMSFSGHKMFGPTGIGVLWARSEMLQGMSPYQGGGEMIKSVSFEGSTWNDPPWRFEAGTPNIGGAIGLGAAVQWLEEIGMDAIASHDAAMTSELVDRLSHIPRVVLVGTPADRSGAVSFNVEDMHHADVGMLLDRHGIAVRTGHHCAEPSMDRMSVTGTVRASLGCFTNSSDLEALDTALRRVIEVFG